MSKENKIAVYAICRNELQFVDKWYNSMREADLIAVLDTGSTDGTYERLQEIAATDDKFIVAQKTYNPWRFDTPRNDAMELVPRDYNILISTDLDEILNPGWATVLRDRWIEGTHERASYMYAWSHNESGEPGRVFAYNKVHNWDWKWKYPVHELLYNTVTGGELYPKEHELWLGFDMFLHHYPDSSKSRSNYLPLLELRAQENTDDLYGLIYLAHEYNYRGMPQKSIDTLEQCIERVKKEEESQLLLASCYLFMGEDYEALDNKKAAISCYIKSTNEDPTYREGYLNLASVLIDQKQYVLAISYIHEALNNSYRHYSWLERDDSWTCKPFDLLTLAYYYSGDKLKSLACAYRAYKEDPNNKRLKDNLDIVLDSLEDKEY